MTLTARSGVALLAALAGAAALAGVSVHLQVSRIAPAKDKLEVIDEALQREREAATRRSVYEDEKARLDGRQAEFRELLPPGAEGDLESLRRSLVDAAERAGVLVTAVRPAPAPAAHGAVEEIVLAVEAAGDFASLGRFLDAVESLRRAVVVDQFELKPAEGEADAAGRAEPVRATLAMRLTAWRVREEGR